MGAAFNARINCYTGFDTSLAGPRIVLNGGAAAVKATLTKSAPGRALTAAAPPCEPAYTASEVVRCLNDRYGETMDLPLRSEGGMLAISGGQQTPLNLFKAEPASADVVTTLSQLGAN